MLQEKHLDGYVRDKVSVAIDRLKTFEPEEGYYLAFSGGKDSQCIYHLAVEAGVKFDAHYHITGIDHPKLVYFIRQKYPDVKREPYKQSMFRLIEKQGLPTRLKRFCCAELKERGGEGRIAITGVRWAESVKRKNQRKPLEVQKGKEFILFDDNEEGRRLFETCMQKGKRVVNPIIDWLDEDVWEYLNSRGIEHCRLYDEGYKRLGCVGCPMDTHRAKVLEVYPKFYNAYLRAAERYMIGYLGRCKAKGKKPFKETVQELMDWWIYEPETIDYTDSFLEDD